MLMVSRAIYIKIQTHFLYLSMYLLPKIFYEICLKSNVCCAAIYFLSENVVSYEFVLMRVNKKSEKPKMDFPFLPKNVCCSVTDANTISFKNR